MDLRHRSVQALGAAAMLCGAVFDLLVIRTLAFRHVEDIWGWEDLLFAAAFAAYLFWVGVRAMRWARGEIPITLVRIKWGRIFLGSLLVYNEIKNFLHPAANLLRPSNSTQAQAMKATEIGFAVLGVYLIVSGVIPQFRKQVATRSIG